MLAGRECGVQALTDLHTDVVGNFSAASTSLSGTSVYDPLGNVVSATGMRGQLGYQSAWTDPVNGRVDMGARWYDPAIGQFTSRDTAHVDPDPDPAAANPFAYAGDGPLTSTDPSGHLMIDAGNGLIGSIQNVVRRAAHHHWHAPVYTWHPPPPCSWWSCAWHAIRNVAKKVYRTARTVVRHVETAAEKAAAVVAADARDELNDLRADLALAEAVAGHLAHDISTAVHDAGSVVSAAASVTWRAVKSATSGTIHAVTRAAKSTGNFLHTAAKDIGKAATATGHFLKAHAAVIASTIASTVVFLGCDAALGIASGGVGAVVGASACGALAGAVGNAVSYGITAAQNHDFSLSGLLKSAAVGAATGALGGALGGAFDALGGVASDLLSGGAEEDVSELAESGAAEGAEDDEAASSSDGADSTTRDRSSEEPSSASEEEDTGAPSCQVGGQSFTAGTKVLTASGTLVPISRLKVGDKVLATNTKTGKTAPEPVAAVLVHHDTDKYDLKVRTAHGGAVIDTTRNHLFWRPAGHRWVKAAALKYGTHLRTSDGSLATVTGGYDPRDTTGWMWDLTIPGNDDHDFYIQAAGTTAVLVHNVCGTVYRFGSKPGYQSQYISATTDPDVAAAWAARTGGRWVSIDLDQVDGEVTDLSTYEGRAYNVLDWKGRGYAMKSSEVIIEGNIPASAIRLMGDGE